MSPARIIVHGRGQKVTHFTKNESCQQSFSAATASPLLFVSNSWVLDVQDGDCDCFSSATTEKVRRA